jgi:predicted amidohydrolase YtcJ
LDLIIKNAKIITMDENVNEAECVGIENGRISMVGKFEDIKQFARKDTEIIDLDNKTLLPGFNDSHMHLLSYGLSLKKVNLSKSKSLEELILTLKRFIEENKIDETKWVQGIGYNQDYFEVKEFPTRYDLDKASIVNPICIVRACYHIACVNSRALEIMGIDKSTPEIKGGLIDLDENGEPLGIFRENALCLIYVNIPEPDIQELKDVIYEVNLKALSKGITSIQSDDFEHLPSKNYNKIIEAYQELNQQGKLMVRINEQCLLPNMPRLDNFIKNEYSKINTNEFFKLGPIKLLTDGSLGARTALLNSPYSDDSSTCGICIYEQKVLDELVITAHNNNIQVALHCIGDKAMYMAFESIEKAIGDNINADYRHSIIHCQITDEELLNKFRKFNVIANIQPIFLDNDLHIVESRVGASRAKMSYNWKGLLQRGVKIACGSDCPVEDFDVLENIYCAVTRKDLSGYPENGWLPEQKLSLYEALYGFTMGGAYASFEEGIKGSITPNKLADMVVLSENILDIDINEIKNVKILKTFVGGKLVYDNKKAFHNK